MPEEGRGGTAAAGVVEFVLGSAFDALPRDVVAQAQRCLLDLIGVAAAGRRTQASGIAIAYAAAQLGGSPSARILFDGRRASTAGAAFAGATTIDAIDAHDGHVITKGHAGVAVLPALLALADAQSIDGREFLTSLAIGYEVATRAGIALHASVADYHCSGAWNAIGCAAVAARRLGLDREVTRHALGIAEYFGPRGQILRACDTPSMVKDGSGWGAHAGLSAAWLAHEGFTGAPAITVERQPQHWNDVGVRWRILEQYFKPYPVCRWAQPAIEAALALRRRHALDVDAIARVEIDSFREAVALGRGCACPTTTEEAQYSLPYPVAAALVFGRLGVDEITAPALDDVRVRRLAAAMSLREDAQFSARFPKERWARVRLVLADGRTLASDPARTRGDPDAPLDDRALRDKFHSMADPVLGEARAARIERAVSDLADRCDAARALVDDLSTAA
jgi:2-methylcitrate dehydratase PrpD